MSTITGIGTRRFGHPIATCAFFIGTTLTGHAAQFGNFTYEEHDTYIEITDYPDYATGDVTIPSEIVGKPVTSIGGWAFYNARSLTSVTTGDNVTSIGKRAFFFCSGLASVTIGTGVTSIGEEAFSYCTSLETITVNSANSAYSSVDGVLFETAGTALLKYPEGRVGAYAVPDGVTTIGDKAFRSCGGLTSITFPDGVTSIGERAFDSCSSLTSVYFEGDAPSIGEMAFRFSSTAIVYYLPGTTGWEATYGGRPTELTSGLPDPLIGGAPVDGLEGRFLSEWWGEYNAKYAPWLFHAEHGYIYRYPNSTDTSMYFYDDAMEAWWWTNGEVYPFLYAFDPPADLGPEVDIGSEWLYYLEESNDPRVFGVVTGDHTGEFLLFEP